jgi:hypothetical protein
LEHSRVSGVLAGEGIEADSSLVTDVNETSVDQLTQSRDAFSMIQKGARSDGPS